MTPGAIHRPQALAVVPGGKGLNAARAAVHLGGRVTVVGLLAGRAGDWIRDGIAARGIDARWGAAQGETRTCVSLLDRATGELTEIYERGEPVDGMMWDSLERLVASELEAGGVRCLALSGSLPPGAPGDGFGRIADLARSAGSASAPIAVLADTYGTALPPVLARRPELVKVNAEEAAGASGLAVTDADSAEPAARMLLGAGASGVVVTLGRRGAVVATPSGFTRLVPPDVDGTYPVGSGDAFLAGMAVALARGDDLVEAARLGLAAGTANALMPGAGELDPTAVGPLLKGISLVEGSR